MTSPFDLSGIDLNSLEPTPDELQRMRTILSQIPDVMSKLDKANRAGLDVNSAIENIKDLERRINQVLKVYGN